MLFGLKPSTMPCAIKEPSIYRSIIGPLVANQIASFLIDLMHNDAKQCFSNVHCGSCSHARIHRNADMCSDVAGASSSSSGDLFGLSDRSNTTFFNYFPHY